MAASASKGGSWMDTILNLIPGRRAAASNEPSEDAIKRTHDNLRCLTLPEKKNCLFKAILPGKSPCYMHPLPCEMPCTLGSWLVQDTFLSVVGFGAVCLLYSLSLSIIWHT